MQVLEKLRAKVVRLEAEVKAGRWESGDRYFFSFPSIVFVTTNLDLFVFRANRFSNLTTPYLSELYIIHACLLEDHVSTTMLLCQQEAVIVELDRQQVEVQ